MHVNPSPFRHRIKSLENDARSLQQKIQRGEARYGSDVEPFVAALRSAKQTELKRVAQALGVQWENDSYRMKIAIDDKLSSLLAQQKKQSPGNASADKLLAAFDGMGRSHVDIADLRDAANIGRSEFDNALRELRRKGVLTVSGYEGHYPPTERQRAAAIKEDNSLIGWITRRR